MHLILVGATGLVGSSCLRAMLAREEVTKISIISRRPVRMAEGHPKVTTLLHKDFSRYDPGLMESLQDASACIWALGISSNGATEKDYTTITYEYPLAAATAFAEVDRNFTFVYVSGEGATTAPSRLTPMFGKAKGRAEASLLDIAKEKQLFHPFSVRPAYVDPSAEPDIHPYLPPKTLAMKLSAAIAPALQMFYKNAITPSQTLGQYLVNLAVSDGSPVQHPGVEGGGRIIPNAVIRDMSGI